MTEQTQPTDAEILDAVKHLGAAMLSPVEVARAVLAKWGTPAGAGEPAGRVVSANCQYATVEWLQQTSEVGGGDPDNSRSWPITGDAVYLTPQPTQAQAGAVPLPQYRLLEPRVDRIEAEDEFLQDDAQTWATDPNGTFVGTIYGYALRAARRRIKGADHA